MNERRKIVIQTGNDADDSLSTPHFDTEATLTARPVVPLGEGVAGQAYDSRRSRTGKPWNPLLLVLIVVGAVGLGVATGLAIGFYKNRQAATPSVVSQSPAPAQDSNAGQTVEPPAPSPLPTPMEEEARASVPEVEEEPAVVQPKDEKPERAARDERDERDEDRKATPPVAPEKRRASDDEDDDDVIAEDNADEERRAERQRRREERRERRRRERDLEEPAQFPRAIERSGREQINRIRDIFEGRQP